MGTSIDDSKRIFHGASVREPLATAGLAVALVAALLCVSLNGSDELHEHGGQILKSTPDEVHDDSNSSIGAKVRASPFDARNQAPVTLAHSDQDGALHRIDSPAVTAYRPDTEYCV